MNHNYEVLTRTALAINERQREYDAIVTAIALRELPESKESDVMLEGARKRLMSAKAAFNDALIAAQCDLGLF